MVRFLLIAFVMLCSFDVYAEDPPNSDQLLVEAAQNLKKAHVEREWSACMAQVNNENTCKKLLGLL